MTQIHFRLNYPLNAFNGSVYALKGHHPECHRQIFPLLCENGSSPYKNQTLWSLSYWFSVLWCENWAGLPINDRIRAVIPMKHKPPSRENRERDHSRDEIKIKAFSISHKWNVFKITRYSQFLNTFTEHLHYILPFKSSQMWLILAHAKLAATMQGCSGWSPRCF